MDTPSHHSSEPRQPTCFPPVSERSLVEDLSAAPTFEVIETLPLVHEPQKSQPPRSPFIAQKLSSTSNTEQALPRESLPSAPTLTQLTQHLTERASPFQLVKKPEVVPPDPAGSLSTSTAKGPRIATSIPADAQPHTPLRTAIREDHSDPTSRESKPGEKPSTGQWFIMWILVIVLLSLIVMAYDLTQQKGAWIEWLLPSEIKSKIPFFGGEFEWPK